MKRGEAETLISLAFRQRIGVPSRWTATGLPLPENCGTVLISHSHDMIGKDVYHANEQGIYWEMYATVALNHALPDGSCCFNRLRSTIG
jgi:hypothetical protein